MVKPSLSEIEAKRTAKVKSVFWLAKAFWQWHFPNSKSAVGSAGSGAGQVVVLPNRACSGHGFAVGQRWGVEGREASPAMVLGRHAVPLTQSLGIAGYGDKKDV